MKTTGIARLVVASMATVLLSSCACVDYGRAQQALSFRIEPATSIDALSVACITRDGTQHLTPKNGVYAARLPTVQWGNMKMFGLIPVAGQRHPEKSEKVVITKGALIVETISVEEVRRLPQGDDGAFRIKLE